MLRPPTFKNNRPAEVILKSEHDVLNINLNTSDAHKDIRFDRTPEQLITACNGFIPLCETKFSQDISSNEFIPQN